MNLVLAILWLAMAAVDISLLKLNKSKLEIGKVILDLVLAATYTIMFFTK